MDLSFEFKVLNDLYEDGLVNVYKPISTKEDLEKFRSFYPDCPAWLKPKMIISEQIQEDVLVKNDVVTRRYVSDLTDITIQEAIDKDGSVFKDRYWVEDNGTKFMVKGSFTKMKSHKQKLLTQNKIGFKR